MGWLGSTLLIRDGSDWFRCYCNIFIDHWNWLASSSLSSYASGKWVVALVLVAFEEVLHGKRERERGKGGGQGVSWWRRRRRKKEAINLSKSAKRNSIQKKKREREKNREKRFRPTSAATSALLLLLLLVSLRFMNFPSSFLLQRNENENNMGPPLLPILLFLFLLVHLMTLHCITPIVSTVSMLEASWRASELGSDIEFSLADLIGIFAGNPSSLMFNWTESPGDWCWLKLIL